MRVLTTRPLTVRRASPGGATGQRLLLLWFWVVMSLLPAGVRAQGGAVELAIKATYLYKFPPFVEWPPGALPPGGNFTLCIVGDDPFDGILDRAIAGQSIKDRPVIIRRSIFFNAEANCQIVIAIGSPAQPVPAILAAASGKPILTVTDIANDGKAKGMLNFVVVDNRVRFEIDDAAAAAAGLAVSSKLLSLAVHVRPRG